MSLEVLYNCERNSIKRPEDAVLCCIHYSLISDGFKCVGNGEQIPTTDVKRSDMLPAGWSDNDHYALVYQSASGGDASFLVLKVVTFDGLMLVHLMRVSDEKAVSIEVKTEDHTTKNLTSFDSAYQNLETLQHRLKTELVGSFVHKTSENTASTASRPSIVNQEAQQRTADPLRVPRHRQEDWYPQTDPFAIGVGDLDPMRGGLSGGMVFDPLRQPSGFNTRFEGGYTGIGGPALPRNALVPGARFDPFGPPDLDRSGNVRPYGNGGYRSGPNPDHLPPPGYDDMFM